MALGIHMTIRTHVTLREMNSVARAALGVVVLTLVLAGAANAQTAQSTPVPTPRSQYSPFGSGWSKPFPQTGGYIYMDPRLRSGNQPIRPQGRGGACGPGRIRDSTTGACY